MCAVVIWLFVVTGVIIFITIVSSGGDDPDDFDMDVGA